jgi:hypothetical protein
MGNKLNTAIGAALAEPLCAHRLIATSDSD